MGISAEQQARDLLERLSDCTYYNDPQCLSAGDIVELANIISDLARARVEIEQLTEQYRELHDAVHNYLTDPIASEKINRYILKRRVGLAEHKPRPETTKDTHKHDWEIFDERFGSNVLPDLYVWKCLICGDFQNTTGNPPQTEKDG